MSERVELGDVVRDTITGFEGVAVCISEWLNMCRRVTVQPQKLKKDGGSYDTETIDEPQLTVVKRAKQATPLRRTGGPKPAPKRTGR